jgi:hypothetical protein
MRMTSRTSARRMLLRSGRYRSRLGLSSLTRVSPTMQRRRRVAHSTGLFGISALRSVVWLMMPKGGHRRRQCPRINRSLQIRIGVSDVPASPPPPNFEIKPGDWSAIRKMCTRAGAGMGCGYLCSGARERWHLLKLEQSGELKSNTFPSPTDKAQGPFPLPGGGSGFILPVQPAPVVPAAAASPIAPAAR